MSKANEIENRLIDFAVDIIHLCGSMPNSMEIKHIKGQMLRSGTSPAPNYAEARSAESPKDFVHKVKIALKEMNETRIWIKMLIRSKLLPDTNLSTILNEYEQLCRILSATAHTAKSRITK